MHADQIEAVLADAMPILEDIREQLCRLELTEEEAITMACKVGLGMAHAIFKLETSSRLVPTEVIRNEPKGNS